MGQQQWLQYHRRKKKTKISGHGAIMLSQIMALIKRVKLFRVFIVDRNLVVEFCVWYGLIWSSIFDFSFFIFFFFVFIYSFHHIDGNAFVKESLSIWITMQFPKKVYHRNGSTLIGLIVKGGLDVC